MSEKLFKTDEELNEAIQAYFDEIKVSEKKPTITGLAYHLGFADRCSFYDYEKIPEHTYTIKRARTFIESTYEEQLRENNVTGAIFALKNFGWRDKQEMEHSGKLTLEELISKGNE